MRVSILPVGRLAALFVGSILLVACSAQQSPNGEPTQTSTTSAAPPTTPMASSDAALVVSPSSVDLCNGNNPIVVVVNWHSTDPHVKLMVSNPAQTTSKLFSEGGFSGQATSGHWVTVGTRFTLIDSHTNDLLATYTMPKARCEHR